MMVGEDPLSCVPLAKGADKRSEGKVVKWVRSWWKDTEGAPAYVLVLTSLQLAKTCQPKQHQ